MLTVRHRIDGLESQKKQKSISKMVRHRIDGLEISGGFFRL